MTVSSRIDIFRFVEEIDEEHIYRMSGQIMLDTILHPRRKGGVSAKDISA